MFEWLSGNPDSTFWLTVDRISILLSYVVVVSVVALVWQVLRFLRHRRRLRRVAGKSRRPQALALAFGGGSIRVAVEGFLANAYEVTIPVEEYAGDEVTPANIHRHLEKIRRLKERFQSEGVTELHLFLKAPMALALAVGAVFTNWGEVKVYQQSRAGGYEAWTTLAQAKAASIPDELTERLLETLDRSGNGI